eukprot:TRINITY_DN8577_c0_g1_i2.p1 TRINITY_DN8577_c0_g1~~TRINITY_DN8577_c0_g1_i2.p1  ORF type:complete len:267 (+),score=35.52 TRINITY_DN8577_c0_g1_i2:59-859(+)
MPYGFETELFRDVDRSSCPPTCFYLWRLWYACVEDDQAVARASIEGLMQHSPASINTAYLDGGNTLWAPLHLACEKGSLAIVELLLDNGANLEQDLVESSDERPGTPLHVACLYNHRDVVAALLWRGANVFAKDFEMMRTPLEAAADYGHNNVVDELLQFHSIWNISVETWQPDADRTYKSGFRRWLLDHRWDVADDVWRLEASTCSAAGAFPDTHALLQLCILTHNDQRLDGLRDDGQTVPTWAHAMAKWSFVAVAKARGVPLRD